MESPEIMRQAILEVVHNQITSGNPPATAQTLKRLKKMGSSVEDAKLLIAQCVAVEIFDVMKNQKPFDEKRYVKNLDNLPNESFDD